MPVNIYTTLDDPAAANGTFANGINDAGQIVGGYSGSNNDNHGFLYNPNGGTYTTIDDPLARNGTQAQGINDMGQIVGLYFNSNSIDPAASFLYYPNNPQHIFPPTSP
jgi:probable HAF family extracellular repeat protein